MSYIKNKSISEGTISNAFQLRPFTRRVDSFDANRQIYVTDVIKDDDASSQTLSFIRV